MAARVAAHRGRRLPALALQIEGEPTHGQVALVVPVRHPAGPAVLKVSFPHPGNLGEADAHRIFAGRGAVTLLEVDHTGLVLVLERALPQTLADHVAVGTARSRRPSRSPVTSPTVSRSTRCRASLRWLRPRGGGRTAARPGRRASRRSAGRALDRARKTIQHLAADETPTMLHGDLHFGNILRSHREPWLTIDPKGWFGPRRSTLSPWPPAGRDQLSIGEELHAASCAE